MRSNRRFSRQRAPRLALPPEVVQPRDTHRSLPLALVRAREAVMQRFRPMLAARRVTEQQWRAIRILGEAGPLDATELCKRCCLLNPSMTRIIRALLRRGLITRAGDKGDRRRTILALSSKAQILLTKVTPESRKVYQQLEADFGKQWLERLLDDLDILAGSKR